MNDIIEAETDEQRDTRLRLARTRRALMYAPEVVRDLCGLVFPTDGTTERGEWVPVARIPMRGHALDDVNELYGALVEGVGEFAQPLGADPSDAGRFARWQTRNVDGHVVASVYGLPDRFTPAIAEQLTRRITTWLLPHVERLELVPGGREWLDDVVRLVWRFRHQYRIDIARFREVATRHCPVCKSDVDVTFFGQPFGDAEVRGEFLPLQTADYHPERPIPDERRDPKTRPGRLVLDVREGVHVGCTVCGWAPEASAETLGKWLDGTTARLAPVPGRRNLLDDDDLWWTRDQAAAHFSVKPATIRAWIRDGNVTEYPKGLLRRDELLAEFIRRVEAKGGPTRWGAHDSALTTIPG